MLLTILLVLLILMLLGALPTWPHSRNWGYLSERRAWIGFTDPAHRAAHGIPLLIVQCREGGLAMSRFVWMVRLAGLLAAIGCEQKSRGSEARKGHVRRRTPRCRPGR